MNIVQSILTKNPCYTEGRKITIKGLMLHSVGCPQPRASAFINSWNSPSYGAACVHAFIDAADGTVYQTLPWNHRGWHCGSGSKGSGNNTHIGVEMCEPDCIKYTSGSGFTCSDLGKAREMVQRTYESAVGLFAYLCRQYGLNPTADGVIISHKEGCSRGIATNHGDPEHLWKGLGMGYTMDGFRKAVKAAMGSTSANTSTGTQSTAIGADTVATGCLGRGDSGAEVKALQANLTSLGYSCGPSGADGDFGANTEAAVKAFQKANGLTADGLAGEKTQAKIKELLAAKQEPAKTSGAAKYYVQVGAYKSKPNAQAMVDKLKKADFDAAIKTVSGLYCVQAGAYSSKANAQAMVEKLKKAGFDAIIKEA